MIVPPRIRPLLLLFPLLLVKLGLTMRGAAFALKPNVRVGLLVCVSPRLLSLCLANQKVVVSAVVLPLRSLICSPLPPPPSSPTAAFNFLTLNVHGIRDPIKRAGLLQWMSHLSCGFVCLQEAHVNDAAEATSWFSSTGFLTVTAPGTAHSRGQVLLYRPSLSFVNSWVGRSPQCSELQTRWALHKPRNEAVRFPTEVKQYLTTNFDLGERTGIQSDPAKVTADMRTSKNPDSSQIFERKHWLTKGQVWGFFSKHIGKRSMKTYRQSRKSKRDETFLKRRPPTLVLTILSAVIHTVYVTFHTIRNLKHLALLCSRTC